MWTAWASVTPMSSCVAMLSISTWTAVSWLQAIAASIRSARRAFSESSIWPSWIVLAKSLGEKSPLCTDQDPRCSPGPLAGCSLEFRWALVCPDSGRAARVGSWSSRFGRRRDPRSGPACQRGQCVRGSHVGRCHRLCVRRQNAEHRCRPDCSARCVSDRSPCRNARPYLPVPGRLRSSPVGP